jgi:hypothetical protein
MMRCKILRASDDYVLNVRYTDEIADERGMSDAELWEMENQIKAQGRFWLDADTLVMPIR